MTSGILISGRLYPTSGLVVHPPASHGGPVWAGLGAEDYRMRATERVWQIVIHTTGGRWPQLVIPGIGPGGHAKQIAEMWRGTDRRGGNLVHAGATWIVDYDRQIYSMCDATRVAPHHAEGSNPHSVSIEMCTRPDGSIYAGTIDATVRLVWTLTWNGPGTGLLPIPSQMHRGPYRGAPLARMEVGAGRPPPAGTRVNSGGRDCVGVFGHRDNTSERGRGDPGDEVWRALTALGFEALDYETREDIAIGKARQRTLNQNCNAGLVVDGIVGPASIAAARTAGYWRWRDIPGS